MPVLRRAEFPNSMARERDGVVGRHFRSVVDNERVFRKGIVLSDDRRIAGYEEHDDDTVRDEMAEHLQGAQLGALDEVLQDEATMLPGRSNRDHPLVKLLDGLLLFCSRGQVFTWLGPGFGGEISATAFNQPVNHAMHEACLPGALWPSNEN